jgi:3-oxoacyl-[acyl-carrier-protein] synthase-3
LVNNNKLIARINVDGLKILGTGSYVPELIVTNQMFEAIVDTSDEWITSRTGIAQRHFVSGETSLEMVKAACAGAIADAGIDKGDIGLVICATVTSDYITPALSALLQRELDLPEELLTFDLNGACSGFVYALHVAQSLLQHQPGKYALICAGEILSRLTDFSDRSSCVLFGDGAGAALIGIEENNPYAFAAGAKGNEEFLSCLHPLTGNHHPFGEQKPQQTESPSFLSMNGQEVFRFAVESISKSVANLKQNLQLDNDTITYYVLHQANLRIIYSVARKLAEPLDKFFININKYGNTSAASIALALDNMNRQGLLQRGDTIILAGFGGGLTYGSMLITW